MLDAQKVGLAKDIFRMLAVEKNYWVNMEPVAAKGFLKNLAAIAADLSVFICDRVASPEGKG